jgi:hypothetical protein
MGLVRPLMRRWSSRWQDQKLRIEFIQIVDFGTRTVVPQGTDGRIQG